MNIIAQKQEISTAVAPLLSEPVPIFLREEAGVRSLSGDAVYIARLMLNIDEDAIEVDFAKAPKSDIANSKTNSAKLYPNPAQNEVMIEFDYAIKANAVLEIYGYSGNLLQKSVLQTGYQFISVSTKDLKSGIYFYRILLNSNVIAKDRLLIVK